MDNTNWIFTNHTTVRCQQRGISREAVNFLIKYGEPRNVRDGISYAMDKRSRKRARDGLGVVGYRKMERWINCYVVVSRDGNKVITVAHRLHRCWN